MDAYAKSVPSSEKISRRNKAKKKKEDKRKDLRDNPLSLSLESINNGKKRKSFNLAGKISARGHFSLSKDSQSSTSVLDSLKSPRSDSSCGHQRSASMCTEPPLEFFEGVHRSSLPSISVYDINSPGTNDVDTSEVIVRNNNNTNTSDTSKRKSIPKLFGGGLQKRKSQSRTKNLFPPPVIQKLPSPAPVSPTHSPNSASPFSSLEDMSLNSPETKNNNNNNNNYNENSGNSGSKTTNNQLRSTAKYNNTKFLHVIVTKSREAENENEISVTMGETIRVSLPPMDGWCFAQKGDQFGSVPLDVSKDLKYRYGLSSTDVDFSSIIEYKEVNKSYLQQGLSTRPEPAQLLEQNILVSSPFEHSIDVNSVIGTEISGESIEEQATSLFATKPQKGIDLLIEHKIVENNPESIAEYLFNSRLLSRGAVGEFLGEKGQTAILHCYLHLLCFKDLEFDKALRFFLYSFKLPGESQKIDRIMEAFAKKYYNEYSGNLFAHEDTVYILAYATIMLNTDLHNPYVKKKMTLAEFVNNNRDINQGKSLPLVFLEDLYHRILEDEIKMNDDLFPKATKRGYLLQKNKKKVNRFWFVLDKDSDHLYCFKLETDTTPFKSYCLQNLSIKKQPISRKKKKYFTILLHYNEDGKNTEIKMHTPSQRLWVEWLTCIGDCINGDKEF